jgi:hypothetical protein
VSCTNRAPVIDSITPRTPLATRAFAQPAHHLGVDLGYATEAPRLHSEDNGAAQ